MIVRALDRVGIVFALLSACSCGGSVEPTSPASSESATSGATPSVAVASPEPEAHEGAASHETAPQAAPAVTLVTSTDPYGRVTLSVSNRGSEPAQVSPNLVLEHEAAEAFTAAEQGAFTVGSELATEGCVTLGPGAELSARWSCLRADAPDLVRDCTRAPSGRYRFVVTSCDGRARTEGTAFSY